MRRYAAAVVLAVLLSPAAAAPKAPPPIVGDILACAAEKDATQRLACYDKAAATLAAKTEKGDVYVVEREEVRRTRRALFGFGSVRVPFFKGDTSLDEENNHLDSTISSVQSDGYDKFYLKLADGGLWKTTEPARWDPKAGQPIRIIRTKLGGYMIAGGKLDGVRVIRIG